MHKSGLEQFREWLAEQTPMQQLGVLAGILLAIAAAAVWVTR